MKIYAPNNTELFDVAIAKEAVHEEEIMTSNFVKLSWYGRKRETLPVGSYIIPFSDNVRYVLFDPYTPSKERHRKFRFEPQFQHPVMWLGRIPFIHLQGNTTSWASATKKFDWTYTGYPSVLAQEIVTYINWLSGVYPAFGAVFGTGWTALVSNNLTATESCSFNSTDILSAAAEMASQWDCEYHFDFDQKVFHFGTVSYERTLGQNVVLKSGVNIQVANVSASKEPYYNSFVVLGSTKNLSQQDSAGQNVQVLERLTLDPVSNPDSMIYVGNDGAEITREQFLSSGLPMLTKELIFDDVYPKLELYVYNVRERRRFLLDENNEKIEDSSFASGYKEYAQWYLRLAHQVNGLWVDFTVADEDRIADTDLQISFLPNYDSTIPSPLSGRTFTVVPFTTSGTEYDPDTDVDSGMAYTAGDYRIVFDDGDLIIPTVREQGLYPHTVAGNGQSTENNIVSVIGVVVTEGMKATARDELKQSANEEIARLFTDMNTYSFASDPIAFRESNPNLHIGQKVKYNDGQDLNVTDGVAGTAYELTTHVRKLVTRLDNPNIVDITVGNEKVKGTISTMKEQIETIIAGGYGTGGGGGGLTESQFLQLLRNYGRSLFLSKTGDDTASGVITFLKGILLGANGSWGWVKDSYSRTVGAITTTWDNGVAWFNNLFVNYLEPTLLKVAEKILGPLQIEGNVFIVKDSGGHGGNLSVAGDISAENAVIRDMLTTNNLTVTGLAHFFELVIDKIKAAGGAQIYSPADGFVIQDIETTTVNGVPCLKLWWRATDGDRKISNMWEIGDQAICMNFNQATEGVGYGVSNKFFWSLVKDKGTAPHEYVLSDSSSSDDETETVDSHYICICTGNTISPSSSTYDGNYVGSPSMAEVGDELAMLGHRFTSADYDNGVLKESAKSRQAAVYVSAYSSWDMGTDTLAPLLPPFLAFYKGIDNFNLGSHRTTYIDAKGSRFVGNFVSSNTNQDLENLLTGNEFYIIYGYGNPNTVSHPHYAWNQSAGEYLSHVGWLYFDLDLEPATEGGRLWRWMYIESDSSSSSSGFEPYFTWIPVNDIDSLAALDKIADVASDGKLSGGAEKVRVYLEWLDAKKTAISLRAQAEENDGFLDADDSETDLYNGQDTYLNAYNVISNKFTALSTYLNGGTSFTLASTGVPLWISPESSAYGIKATTILTPPYSASSSSSDEGMTGAEYYRMLWSDFYDAVVELTRALNAWQYRTIESMGDDGLIDPAEKASLREIFNREVQHYFEMMDEAATFGVDGSGDFTGQYVDSEGTTQTLTDLVSAGLNALGTYLDGAYGDAAISSGGTGIGSSPSINNTTGLPDPMVVSTWVVNDNMRGGLTEQTDGSETSTSSDDVDADERSGYPKWLLKEYNTEDVWIQDPVWDAFWKLYWTAKSEMEDALARARQYKIDNMEVDLPSTYYTRFSDSGATPASAAAGSENLTPKLLPNGTSFKVGDIWYEEIALINPVTRALVQHDNDNQPYYNQYVCKTAYTASASVTYDGWGGTADRLSKWRLVFSPIAVVRDTGIDSIYDAVFSSNAFSSVVQNVNSITSTVGKEEGGKNLILNADFSEITTGTYLAKFSGQGLVANPQRESISDLDGFKYAGKATTGTSGSYRGLYLQATDSAQKNMVMENGKWYVLSAWLKSSDGYSVSVVTVNGTTYSNKGTMTEVGGTNTTLTSEWKRYALAIQGTANKVSIILHYSNSGTNINNKTFYIAGIQLEEGSNGADSVSTFWQKGGDTKHSLQSQITQNANSINLCVQEDGVTRAGLKLENDQMFVTASKLKIQGDLDLSSMNNLGEVKINGDKLTIENDLDIKGLTTENVTVVARDHAHPTVINMGIVDSSDGNNATKIKSVQVKAVNKTYATDNVERSHLVVLPFYDSLVGQSGSTLWPNSGDNFISFDTSYDLTSPLYGSFMLYDDSDVNPSLRRVVPWKQAGTRVTVTNEVDYYCANWKTLVERVYNTNTQTIDWRYSSRNTREALSKWLLNRSVVVCSDPRIVCEENVKYYSAGSPQPFIGTYGVVNGRRGVTAAGNNDKCKSGYFSCKGYMARFIILLPGQTLQLRSQIMRLSSSNPVRDVLVWVVENEESFELMYEGTRYFLDGMEDKRYFSIALKSEQDSDDYYVGLYPADVALDQNDDNPTKKDGILGSAAANLFSGNNNRYEGIAFSLGTTS